MDRHIPLDDLTNEQFRRFREEVLNGEMLSEASLRRIRVLFGIEDVHGMHLVSTKCGEEHSHGYACGNYPTASAVVVGRLVEEICKYHRIVRDVGTVSRII
jgi:hypothetical protein